MPEDINAKKIDEAPTSGLTFILRLCALEIIDEPGSAIAGQPASEIKPIEFPVKQISKNVLDSVSNVCLFKTFIEI